MRRSVLVPLVAWVAIILWGAAFGWAVATILKERA